MYMHIVRAPASTEIADPARESPCHRRKTIEGCECPVSTRLCAVPRGIIRPYALFAPIVMGCISHELRPLLRPSVVG